MNGPNSSSSSAARPPPHRPIRICIIGGGFAGLTCARQLLSHLPRCLHVKILLFEAKEYFEYTPSILKCILYGKTNIFLPLRELAIGKCKTDRCEIVQTRIQEIQIHDEESGRGAVVDVQSNSYEFDYCVIATGSNYASNIKAQHYSNPESDTISGRMQILRMLRDQVKSARCITIIGSGLVGVELAAEIAESKLNAHITLRVKGNGILPGLPKSAQEYTTRWLKEHHVTIVYNNPYSVTDYREMCRAKNDGEMVFNCTGIKHMQLPLLKPTHPPFNNSSYTNEEYFVDFHIPPSRSIVQDRKIWKGFISRHGLITVNEYLQLSQGILNSQENGIDTSGEERKDTHTYSNIYAIGDCNLDRTNQAKMAYMAEMMGTAAAINITRQIQKEPVQPYPEVVSTISPPPDFIVCSLGFSSALLIFNDFVFKGRTAALLKWLIEYSKLGQYKGTWLGILIWEIGEPAAFVANRLWHWALGTNRKRNNLAKK